MNPDVENVVLTARLPGTFEKCTAFGFDGSHQEEPYWRSLESRAGESTTVANAVSKLVFLEDSKQSDLEGLSGSPITPNEKSIRIIGLISQQKIERNKAIDIKGISVSSQRDFLERNGIAVEDGEELPASFIRRLGQNLWVNWETGCLGENYLSVVSEDRGGCLHLQKIQKEGAGSSDGHIRKQEGLPVGRGKKQGSFPVKLNKRQLRLLSVLVQGEEMVVSWKELYRRVCVMHVEMEYVQHPGRPDLEKKLRRLRAIKDLAEFREKAEKAIQNLIEACPFLSDLICREEQGCRIRLYGLGIESTGRANTEANRNILEKKDLNIIKEECERIDGRAVVKENGMAAWLRRHTEKVCESFEERISNAGNNDNRENEKAMFGDFPMVRVYSNAYAREAVNGERSDDAEPDPNAHAGKETGDDRAMLDFVEKWYCESLRDSSCHGRGLVIHGRPGDGKTTFCKKAVYVHCHEGWL